jgi:transposase
MTNISDRVEIITSVQRRRRWTAAEKMRLVEQNRLPREFIASRKTL